MKTIIFAFLILCSARAWSQSAINILYPDGSGGQVAVSASKPLPVTLSGSAGSVTETPTFPRYTTGTTGFTAGAYNLQFMPTASATGSIIMSTGTYSIPGAGNLSVIAIPAQAGHTLTSGSVVLTSGTVDSIQNR